ncbi:HK97 gp10 family phage protein [Ochrobactrum intermedium]|uniref:HK97-gp10 family putative phage morphogenesis protein n=1 Tax=Brucella intermedia TaxID=94625 RepID=UPI00128DC53E|nr:HK97-gp10 family putative phage morphogenesis protein [Brucella intermedia]MPR62760.1 HK97 gp10 family phage protein [Brucella intermedia]
MATGARIIGLAKLQKKLNAMPQIAKDEIKKALEQSADEIVELAKSLVPEDTGELRESIGWTYGKVPRGAMTLGKVFASKLATDLTITIYAGNSEAYYARWVEFGTQKMAARPYFYVSYRANKKKAQSRVRRSITRAAKKAAAL